MATKVQGYTTDDIEYLRHGDRPMMLRLYRPAGAGPFPGVIDLHGGAWNNGDRTLCHDRAVALADAGLATAALDFRQAADAYPTSLVDINYSVRWLKAHAKDLSIDPDRIGLSGESSGGHLAMLAAMRADDTRYASIPIGDGSIDARVACVGLSWPVINPLSRYRNALRGAAENPPVEWVGDIPSCHDIYWQTENAMAEGNPVLILERGEKIDLPPALWVNGQPDPVHNYLDPESGGDLREPERFAKLYREAGGDIEVVYIEQETRSTRTSFDPLAAFFRKHLT
jgi:acetyl esterase/lipase